jgi:hypothetical protein
MHPDSEAEFRAKQRRWRRRGGAVRQPGFPEGSWGPYRPFFHPRTSAPFHTADIFDVSSLGYRFDTLPEPLPDPSLFLREMPTFAVFAGIVITQMKQSRNLHVFVVDRAGAEGWAPPSADVDGFHDAAGYAGFESIFGLF